ncbi:MAG: hypothetical protein NC485_10370 [Ruminococcus flavefaciens]|nr:hypothetical protein [Ruminococcus flavefaciens]MCM1059301.1 hypothetical protein [Eubacterium sp.]
MFKSNEEMIAENMPDDDTILILKKDLQTRGGIISKGTRVMLCQEKGGFCDYYKVILSDDYDYVYLSDVIEKDGECILSNDVPKYPQRIQKFISEYFTIDIDRTNEYKAYLEKRHINVGLILILLLWIIGLIAVSIFGWLTGEWCDFFLPSESTFNGIIGNVFFALCWSIIGIMGVAFEIALCNQSAIRKNEEVIKKLLQ